MEALPSTVCLRTQQCGLPRERRADPADIPTPARCLFCKMHTGRRPAGWNREGEDRSQAHVISGSYQCVVSPVDEMAGLWEKTSDHRILRVLHHRAFFQRPGYGSPFLG